MEAGAYDRAASAFARGLLWDRAANAWENAAAAMALSTTPEWQWVSYEYAGNAWGQNGNYSKAATDWQTAGAGWNALAGGNVDKYTAYRDPAFSYWPAS